MTVDMTKPVQTYSGFEVELLATNLNSEKPIVGVVKEEGSDRVVTYYKNGRRYVFSQCPDDLVNVPERVSRWAAIYPKEAYPADREEANRAAYGNQIAMIELVYAGDELVNVIKHELETPIIEEAKDHFGDRARAALAADGENNDRD